MKKPQEHIYVNYPTLPEKLREDSGAINAAQQLGHLFTHSPKQAVDFELNHLITSITRQSRFFQTFKVAHLTFRDLIQAKIAGEFFSQLFPDPARAKLGVMELIINSIEHGNLGITTSEKNELMAEDCWMEEIVRRLQLPEYADKSVHAYCVQHANYVKMTIRDEGQGFDWDQYTYKSKPFYPSRYNGHGIAAAMHISFDEMRYVGKGNVVWALQYIKP